MSAPLLFVALPALVAPVVYGLRHRPRAEITLAVSVAALLALLAVGLPVDQPIGWLGGAAISGSTTILGRAFEIDPADRLALALIFAQAALLFLTAGLAGRSRYFVAAGLMVLGLLAAALFVRPFLFAALFLEIAAALAVFMLADETHPATRGALRFLVFTTFGMPFILLTGWLLEGSAASPADITFVQQATITLAVGFAVLLAVVPFHGWLPVVAERALPLGAAFVYAVPQVSLVFLLLTFLNAYDWLGQNPAIYRALTLAGGGMALVGAVFVFGQRNFGRSLGYAMVIDIGAVLLGVGLGTRAGVEAALATLALRGLALPLWAVGLDHLRRATGGDDFDSLHGAARRYPFASAAVIVGQLSLVGFPLTAGFPARWALLHLLAQIHPNAALLLLAGMVSVSVVCARGLARLLSPREGQVDSPAESRAAVGALGIGLGAVLLLGAFPQWLLPAVARAASTFTHLGP